MSSKRWEVHIVTSLQFDDIVQQLTKHAQSRTRHLQTMFKNIATNLEKLDCKFNSAFNSRILALKHDVNNLKNELQKENPVKQSSLTTGKTELF